MMRFDLNYVSDAVTETFFIAAERPMAVVSRISFPFFFLKEIFLVHCYIV
jgi:hypothetical protein